MFAKFEKTKYPPKIKPVLIWDGECGFCKFWVIRFGTFTKDKIVFQTYQKTAGQYLDIPIKEFKKASRLIEVDGSIYNGPDSLYRSLEHSNEQTWPWHRWYCRHIWFTKLSDFGYNLIAKNRPLMFFLTKTLFGKRPEKFRLYWVIYLLLISILVLIIFR